MNQYLLGIVHYRNGSRTSLSNASLGQYAIFNNSPQYNQYMQKSTLKRCSKYRNKCMTALINTFMQNQTSIS